MPFTRAGFSLWFLCIFWIRNSDAMKKERIFAWNCLNTHWNHYQRGNCTLIKEYMKEKSTNRQIYSTYTHNRSTGSNTKWNLKKSNEYPIFQFVLSFPACAIVINWKQVALKFQFFVHIIFHFHLITNRRIYCLASVLYSNSLLFLRKKIHKTNSTLDDFMWNTEAKFRPIIRETCEDLSNYIVFDYI